MQKNQALFKLYQGGRAGWIQQDYEK